MKRQNYLSPSHLLRMMMLSQRAVDYSIKAHELGAPEIYQLFWKHDQEWSNLQRCIGDRGRTLFIRGKPNDVDSPSDDCALRIYSALCVIYTAAVEIAHTGSLMLERGLTASSPQLREMGRYVNSLVRLCAVALFTKELRHARTILGDHGGRRRFEQSLCNTQQVLNQIPGTRAKLELAIAWALGHIAEQTCEIAHAFTSGHEAENHFNAFDAIPCFAA